MQGRALKVENAIIARAIKGASVIRAISAAAVRVIRDHAVIVDTLFAFVAFETIKYERNRPKKFLANRSSTL